MSGLGRLCSTGRSAVADSPSFFLFFFFLHPPLLPSLLPPPPWILSGCKVRFIGLCENVKIETSLSGTKYTPETKFLDLFAWFLVDKLNITPQGKTSLTYCMRKAIYACTEESHSERDGKILSNVIFSALQMTVAPKQHEFSAALVKEKEKFLWPLPRLLLKSFARKRA